ncbi:MAG: SMC-Scp complex subunit ScpB [Anaerolineales bacterium]|jgi:segregation and condensation protein B|nr:SMC-Scp complex subunit ScpB [Anaerolineales bacterium]
MSDSQNLPELSLSALLEGLLFAAPEPVTPAQMAAALELTPTQIEKGLEALEEDLRGRGLRLQRHAGRVQLTTAPEMAEQVETFLGLEATSRLSRAALEALAIIAFQQPVTRPQVDSIRGVNSDGVMKSLLSKGLLQEVGRSEGPGRPILYGTTPDFLQHFGLNALSELPQLNLETESEKHVELLKS